MEEIKQEHKNRETRKIDLTAFNDPKSPVTEAYRTIRTNLSFSGVDRKLKIILATSALPNEGKSTVLASLSIVMAKVGKKVLLVDCDFRNPTQHKLFGLPNKGVSNCIATGGDFHEIIQHIDQENLDILTSGPVAPNPSEILMSNRMQEFLDMVRDEYDYVLIDTPPIMPVTDSAVLSSRVDGVMLIIASGEEKPGLLKAAKTRLEQAGANIIGCILNKVKIPGGKYGYGSNHYGYGYGYGYGYYYGTEKQEVSENELTKDDKNEN